MGDPKLCLLLLLSTSALAFAQDKDQPTCLLARRYKTLQKYEYRYEAESLNSITGASAVMNGPKASCTVVIEVPQACSFIVRTTGCQLTEVVDMDMDGNPVFGPAPTSDVFAADMERYPLKVVVDGKYDVKLYPEDGETTTILNVKRGIISALAVPLLQGDRRKIMPTIHGKCNTRYSTNSRSSIAADISLTRDLSECDKFVPIRDYTSPLALISGMHYPLAQLIRSSQNCNYKFDDKKKHMIYSFCTEKHILVPFSHNGQYGVTSAGMQELKLVKVSSHNDRIFSHSGIKKDLHMESVEDKSSVQNKDAVLSLLRDLAELDETSGEKRARLFRQLVNVVRGMRAETLRAAVPEALAVSRVLTYQVLAQCGTPECSSAIMQILRTFDISSLEVDAGIFAMAFVSNPSALLISDMLEMAKYKQSKAIMYALSNTVKRFYKAEEKLIPEIYSVAEFMAAQIGDCSGDKDDTFMTLRVIGNMAPAVMAASPALRATVLQCVNLGAAHPVVQQAAIQAFRLITVPEEGRGVLMQVLVDSSSPMQKRVAAYLMLMKEPRMTELEPLLRILSREPNQQFMGFVESHLNNIVSSTEPEGLRFKIRDLLQGNEIGPVIDPTKFSRNYKMGSVEGNMIYEGDSYLPKEVMLEMTLNAFGYDIDMLEIGMEGKGFEPTVEALFGPNGFLPDTMLKTMYFVSDSMPQRFSEILKKFTPGMRRDRVNTQNFLKDLGQNVNKLIRQMKMAESPEAMVYLRLLGNELGYLTTTDMSGFANSAAMVIGSLVSMFQTELINTLTTKTDNSVFAHYIFMDNEFFLPTVTGMPLKVALSGTFTPGIKGGLNVARDMGEISFMPSAGVEFLTQVGSHIPEYVNSGLEMHTNIFHESGLRAKVSMGQDSIKLAIPAPNNPTKLFKITNNLVAVTGSQMMTISPMVTDVVDVNKCTPVFTGMRYCTSLQYVDAFSYDSVPYFPFTGDSKFVMELHPTGEVTEYTATMAYELLMEGDNRQQKVDSVRFIVRAEGADPTEARAFVKYNRKKHVVTADVQIPDYDVEAGIRLGVIDGNTKGKGTHSISLDFVNNNIPQLSLVARANLKAMKEGMLQVQLLVPSVDIDATLTANMRRGQDLELALKSEVKFMEIASEQQIKLNYDASKIKAAFKSDINTDTSMFPNSDRLEKYGNEILDLQVGETDMKVRHIFKKFVEAANNYMEKYGADFPYIQNFRVPDMPEISLPEILFINTETQATYYFNNERYTLSIPLPLGGKSADELRFPSSLSTPRVWLPEIGLEIVSMEVPVPRFVVPKMVTLSIPLFGKAEASTSLKSNLYDMDASVSAGKEVGDTPSYSAKFDVKGTSPVDILSVKFEGSGMLVTAESIKAQVQSSVVHKFIDATLVITEDAWLTDKINLKSERKIEAKTPLGLNFKVEHNWVSGINTEEFSADSSFKGMIMAGPLYGKTTSSQSFTISPFRRTVKIDSNLELDSTIMQAKNTFIATIAKGEMSVLSNTKAFEDMLNHAVELSYKGNKLSFKQGATAYALGMRIHNQAEASAGAGKISMRTETSADRFKDRAYSLVTVGLDVNGLAISSDHMVKVSENGATNNVTLKMNKDGLVIKGTSKLLSPLALENTIDMGFDAFGASLSITNTAEMDDKKFDNVNRLTFTPSSLDFTSKAEAIASEISVYTHDAMITMKPYTASATLANKLMIWTTTLINEAKLQAEPYKMDLTGHVKAVDGQEEIKHLYQASYADLTANIKSSTTGKLFGTHMSYNNELEVMGLAAKLTNDLRFHSQAMRYDHTIRCSAVPFDFNLDAIVNADGDVTMYGTHSGQLYGKVLLRAQPLAFASTHECRASVKQQLDDGFVLETTFDNKIDNVLSLQEQKSNVRMKTKVNEHAFVQLFTVYNKADLAGIEASSNIFTNVFNIESTENQEFSISGFIKYDKNTQSQVIELPLMENLPAFLEGIKGLVVTIAKSLQVFINNAGIREGIEALPDYVTRLINQINIKGYLAQVNQIFDQFSQKSAISIKDMEAFLNNLQATVGMMYADIKLSIGNFAAKVRDVIVSGTLSDAFILEIGKYLKALDAKYNIQATIVSALDIMIQVIQQFDLKQFKGTRMQFLYDIESKHYFLRDARRILRDLKRLVEDFKIKEFAETVKDIARFVFWISEEIIAGMYRSPPFEMIIDMKDYFIGTIQELNIPSKISTGYAQIREVIVKLEADKKIQVILQSAVELIKQLKIEETMKTVSKMIKDANIPATLMEAFQRLIKYLEFNEIKYIIEDLNRMLEALVVKINSLQYNDIVDYANERIAKCTAYVNNLIRTLEVPQKLEATRDFLNQVSFSVRGIVERLQEIKVAEMIKSLKDIMDQLVFDHIRNFAEFAKQKVADFDATTIPKVMELVYQGYREFVDFTTEMVIVAFRLGTIPVGNQKLIWEITAIIRGIGAEVQEGELNVPSFVVPFTDLVVPSWTFSMAELGQIEIPTQLDIPAFTILDRYTVQATTVSIVDIKTKIIELINFFVSFDIGMPDVDAFFGDLTLNFLPPMPVVSFPIVPLPAFSFPSLPQVPVEKLVKSLQVPEIKLPTIPHELTVPCFGKLYGELRIQTPICSVKTSAEFQNSTETEMTPSFTGFLTSQATSQIFDFLNYKLDTSARIAMPKMSRIVLAETFKLLNPAVGVEHQASVSLYGLSAQAQAKTSVKVNTRPYVGVFLNTAFIAMEEGTTGSLETSYSHLLNIPTFDVRNEVLATQKAIVRQNGFTVTLTVDNSGNSKHNAEDEWSHKSACQVSLTPSIVTLAFSGDTDSTLLKMKQQVSAELGPLRYFKFSVRNEAAAPIIQKSLLVASGQGSIFDMKMDLKGSHRTDLFGSVTGFLANELNIGLQPFEFVFEYLNKGNAKINVFKDLAAIVDVQNDYSASFRPGSQQVNAVALLSLNQYKAFCNFTADNNENQAGVFAVMEGQADLEILRIPIDIPSIDLPLVDFRTPAVTNLNLYELTGLRNILKTTQQVVNVDAKVVYQKSQEVPLAMIGMIQIPAVGNLITELSFKSAFIDLNVNAGIYTEDDLLIRLRGTTTSDFDFLKAKLDCTTSLSTERRIRLANSVSLENNHFEGTHESTFAVSAETFEAAASIATAAKIALPVLNVEATQTFVADSRITTPVFTFTIKGDFNIPVIQAVGKANAYCKTKLDNTPDFVSVASEMRASVNGTVLEDYAMFGVLDNVLDLSLNENGLRSTSKITADGKLYQDTSTILSMDANEKLSVEVSFSRVFAMLEHISNNEANLFNMNTNGKHLAKAKVDFTPVSFLTADIEIDLFQPSSLGDFAFLMKNVAELASRVQKVSTIMGFSSPLYNTKLDAVAEGNAPVFKVTMKSSGSSVLTILDYITDVSSTVNLVNEAQLMISKVTLAHSELNVDFSQALSSSQHTANAAITGPAFADVSLRYASGRDGMSASASSPSAGFLGLQVNSRVPSQMTARVYSRYPSAPEVDVDVLAVRSVVKDDKTKLQMAYNMEVPRSMLSELKTRIPSVLSAVTLLAEKHQIARLVEDLKAAAVVQVDEAYDTLISSNLQLSQLSVFFRISFVQYQKTVQAFIDAVVKVLRETKFKLSGSDELTTIPEVLKEVTRSIGVVLEKILQNIYASVQFYYDAYVEMLTDVNLSMPVGDVLASNQFFTELKKDTTVLFMDFVKNMESLDTMLVKVGETLKAVTEKTQDFVDLIESEYFNVVLVNINLQYLDFIVTLKSVVGPLADLNMEDLSSACEDIVDMLVYVTEQINNVVYGFLQQASEEVQTYVTVSGTILEIDVPLSFQ